MTPEEVPFSRTEKKTGACPICGKPPLDAVAPFCSKRCANVDLHRWLGGVYAVPADEPGQPDPASEDDR